MRESEGTPRKVLAIGIRRADPDWLIALGPEALTRMMREASDGAIIVLGDEALLHFEPTALARIVGKQHLVVLCPVACPRKHLAGWVAAGFTTVTEEHEVAAFLETLGGERPRLADVPMTEWIDSVPGSAAHEALLVLQDLSISHSVGAWAAALRWDRRLLWDVCRTDLKLTPRQVLLLHVRAQVASLRMQGFSVASIARRLGYQSAASLCNAFARRGWRIPPRGSLDRRNRSGRLVR